MKLEGVSFKAFSNSENGSLNSETIMNFTSESDVILGNYSGGTITAGHVLARRISENELEMLYQGATTSGEIQAGQAKATFVQTGNGEYEMHLDWQWLTGDQSKGTSQWMHVLNNNT